MKSTVVYILILWASQSFILRSLFAQEMFSETDSFSVRIDTQDKDGVFYGAQQVQCFIEITNRSDENIKLSIDWEISTDDWQPLMKRSLSLELDGNQSTSAFCPWYAFKDPGFYRYSAKLSDGFGRSGQVSMVIGIEPEALRPLLNPPDDFMDFWDKSVQELNVINPDYGLKPIKRAGKTRTDLYEVEMQSFGNLTVRGWLEVPKKKGKYPTLLRVPGYTENLRPLDKYEDMIIFSFNTRDHGESDNTGVRSYDMWVRGMESKENYYYRGIFLDCMRAIDYLESRDDVDMERLAIWGGSQGGGLSFAIAALDQRVKLCVVDIPYMCDYPRYFAITHWNEIDHWFAEDASHTWELMYNTLSYFDTKYLAKRIKCPVMMGIGLQDDVCPPSTSFMTFNLIEGDKSFDIYKNEKHAQPDAHYENRFLSIRKFFGID
ncbi:MAG: acetylxylan esterase [Cytophagales bacterium]|nr:acetylxylan esterase [Cytophagales bacterium]